MKNRFLVIQRLGLKLYSSLTMPVAERFGLTYMEFTLILFLANNPEYRRASDAVENLGMAKSHVSMTIRSLEKKGLITKVCDSGDKRASILELSDKARPIVDAGHRAQDEYILAVMEGLNDSERNLAESLMERIERNVRNRLI